MTHSVRELGLETDLAGGIQLQALLSLDLGAQAYGVLQDSHLVLFSPAGGRGNVRLEEVLSGHLPQVSCGGYKGVVKGFCVVKGVIKGFCVVNGVIKDILLSKRSYDTYFEG